MTTEPPETFGDFPKITQLISGKAKARSRIWSEDSFNYFSAAFKDNGQVGERVNRGNFPSQFESMDERNGIFLVEKEECLCCLCQFFSGLKTGD